MRLDRQAQAGHCSDVAAVTGDRQSDFAGHDRAAAGLHPDNRAAFALDPGHLAILDDVDAARIGAARIAPSDRVVPGGAAARLQQRAIDGKSRAGREIEIGHNGAHRFAVEQDGVDAVEAHGVAAPAMRIHLGVGMGEVNDAALGEHDVVIEVARQSLPQFQRMLIELRVRLVQVVRAHDRRVAPGIAAT